MIPFSPPRTHPEVIEEIKQTLESGWITTGPKTKLFEKRITEYTGCKITNALNSATAGMEMVLRWYGIKKGDEVIIPAYTYCSTANVVVHLGAKPVMVDVSKDDFNITVQNIANAISKNTKAIIPVDISGLPCDYDEINKLVQSEEVKAKFSSNSDNQAKLGRILVMSDAAHSFGAIYKGKRTGVLTDVSVFSFHAVKNLTTAEGGCICWNLPHQFDHNEVYKQINTSSLHGQNKDALAKTKKGAWRYDVTEAGYKCNMTDIHACIGLVELDKYQENLDKRKAIFKAYYKGFENENWAILPHSEKDNKTSSFHLFLLRFKEISEEQRDAIIQEIFEQDVSVNVHFIPLPLLTVYKNKGYIATDYPNALDNFSREITLPVYFDLSMDNVEKVINAVKNAYKKVVA